MKFLSFGAGVQSSTLLMMTIRGDLLRVDHVIFADTGFEPEAVYRHVEWSRAQCEAAGLPFHTVKAERDMREDFDAFKSGDVKYWNSRPPLWVETDSGIAQFGRQCTARAKVTPVNREQLRLMGHKTARSAVDAEAEVWIGISTDELRRASPSRERWIDRLFPLIDPLRMSRGACQAWWDSRYPEVPLPSSSCTICPYHSDRWWRDMPADDFAEACDYDELIRRTYQDKTDQSVYLHRSGKPLRGIDFTRGQDDLFGDDEMVCSGGCGL